MTPSLRSRFRRALRHAMLAAAAALAMPLPGVCAPLPAQADGHVAALQAERPAR